MKLFESRLVDADQQTAFEYTADFSNIAEWDPGVDSSTRVDEGPVEVGSQFDLMVRFGSSVSRMRYRVTEFQPPYRVVVEGEGKRVTAVDEITFTPAGDKLRVDYTADIRFKGALRLASPLLRGTLRKIGVKAVDGLAGALQR